MAYEIFVGGGRVSRHITIDAARIAAKKFFEKCGQEVLIFLGGHLVEVFRR